jgi:hypothetical protein
MFTYRFTQRRARHLRCRRRAATQGVGRRRAYPSQRIGARSRVIPPCRAEPYGAPAPCASAAQA